MCSETGQDLVEPIPSRPNGKTVARSIGSSCGPSCGPDGIC